MRLLAVDTSTAACSVAAWSASGLVCERFEWSGQGHSERLLPMVDEVLAEAGWRLEACDALAFGRGPGSFTALRIGIGVVQGLARGTGLPVVPVSSLAALAQVQPADQVLAAVDARMGQVYWAPFARDAGGLMRPAAKERVTAPGEVRWRAAGAWIGAGSGWDQYGGVLLSSLGGVVTAWRPGEAPRAAGVAALAAPELAAGRVLDAARALPEYVRNQVARRTGGRE